MIKATGVIDGKEVVFLGLSFENLYRFRKEDGDTYIYVHGEEVGLNKDIIILSGETEKHIMVRLLAHDREEH